MGSSHISRLSGSRPSPANNSAASRSRSAKCAGAMPMPGTKGVGRQRWRRITGGCRLAYSFMVLMRGCMKAHSLLSKPKRVWCSIMRLRWRR